MRVRWCHREGEMPEMEGHGMGEEMKNQRKEREIRVREGHGKGVVTERYRRESEEAK